MQYRNRLKAPQHSVQCAVCSTGCIAVQCAVHAVCTTHCVVQCSVTVQCMQCRWMSCSLGSESKRASLQIDPLTSLRLLSSPSACCSSWYIHDEQMLMSEIYQSGEGGLVLPSCMLLLRTHSYHRSPRRIQLTS